MMENNKKSNWLTEEEIVEFWKTDDEGKKSFKSYKIFSILISTFLLVALSIIIFAPFRIEKILGSNFIKNYSLFQIVFDKKLRVSIYGQGLDNYNFIIYLGEFAYSLILFILIFIMFIKIFTVQNNLFKRLLYIKIYEQIKMPVSSKHSTRIWNSIIWIFIVLLYEGIIYIAEYELYSDSYNFQTVSYICIIFILNMLVCILLYLRNCQYTTIKNKILKTKFYRSNKDEVQKM